MYSGYLRKMHVEASSPVMYSLCFSTGEKFPLNSYIGQVITLSFNGDIQCVACKRDIQKTFNQGYCYPCFMKKAACDSCIVKPELCHFAEGTCREPEWGLSHCMQPHIVYLANSSNLKVGITRCTQVPIRWMDQGAIQALPLYQVNSRLQSGLVEVIIKDFLSDKTNWRTMLKSTPDCVDLLKFWVDLESMHKIEARFESDPRLENQVTPLYHSDKTRLFTYPVEHYPNKISTVNILKTPTFTSRLQGIKGQYLIFDEAVINIRKYTGYHCDLSVES